MDTLKPVDPVIVSLVSQVLVIFLQLGFTTLLWISAVFLFGFAWPLIFIPLGLTVLYLTVYGFLAIVTYESHNYGKART